jgi:lipoprotein-releasing system ATP-binding protein
MKGLIRAEGIEKSFYTAAGELKVLKGIDAVFDEGEIVGIVGASGAGKSTFLHILGTLDKPTQGRVFFKTDEKETDPFSLSNGDLALFRNGMVGFIFQFHYLLPEFSALENVMMPGMIAVSHKPSAAGYKELYERAEKLLDELGLYPRKDHKPGELSGGEQQRVAVARALLLEPKAVLADEPTGNLDTATGEELFRLLMDINQKRGITFIIVTHNESLSKRCHRILEMRDGSLISHS